MSLDKVIFYVLLLGDRIIERYNGRQEFSQTTVLFNLEDHRKINKERISLPFPLPLRGMRKTSKAGLWFNTETFEHKFIFLNKPDHSILCASLWNYNRITHSECTFNMTRSLQKYKDSIENSQTCSQGNEFNSDNINTNSK